MAASPNGDVCRPAHQVYLIENQAKSYAHVASDNGTDGGGARYPTIRRAQILLGNVSMVAILCVAAFAAVELVSRTMWSSRSSFERKFPVQIYRKPYPYIMFKGDPAGTDYYPFQHKVLNELGYPGPVPTRKKPSDEFRIMFLGGSTLVEGAPTIAQLVEEELRTNRDRHVRVYNFGVISSVSSMELARLVFEVADYEPDFIVMYNGANDMSHPYWGDPRPGYPFNFIVYEANPLLESEVGSYPGLALFAYESNLFRILGRKYFESAFADLEGKRQAAGFGSDQWRGAIAKTYVDNLTKTQRVAGTFRSGFLACFQPMVYYKDTRTSEEARLFQPEDLAHHEALRRLILARAQPLRDRGELKLVDLSDIYDHATDSMFTDNVHTHQTAKPVVAKAIAAAIVQELTVSVH